MVVILSALRVDRTPPPPPPPSGGGGLILSCTQIKLLVGKIIVSMFAKLKFQFNKNYIKENIVVIPATLSFLE
jgi:hypothetical protein